MSKHAAAGGSYLEVDDAGGTPHDLSPYLDEVEPLGQMVAALDVTGLGDAAPQVVPGAQAPQEFVIRGAFDDTASIGADAVLAAIVGQTVTVSYGPAGNAPGRRKITGEFLCLAYRVTSRAGQQVRFMARFRQAGAVSLTAW